jgi:hypothetical protein
MSRLGLPATVTSPGFTGCLYCRWLPLVRARRQPSSCGSLLNSTTFNYPSEAESGLPSVAPAPTPRLIPDAAAHPPAAGDA